MAHCTAQSIAPSIARVTSSLLPPRQVNLSSAATNIVAGGLTGVFGATPSASGGGGGGPSGHAAAGFKVCHVPRGRPQVARVRIGSRHNKDEPLVRATAAPQLAADAKAKALADAEAEADAAEGAAGDDAAGAGGGLGGVGLGGAPPAAAAPAAPAAGGVASYFGGVGASTRLFSPEI